MAGTTRTKGMKWTTQTRVLLWSALICAASIGCTQTRIPTSHDDKPAPPITDNTAPGSAKPHASGLKKTTVGERFKDAPFATLLNPPAKVALKAGGVIDVHAQTCGACHSDIYAEWKQSTHAAALRDPQYMAELSKKSSPRWLCLNCHIPLQAQRDYIVNKDTVVYASASDVRKIEKVNNPNFDVALQKEAITCATCHVRADHDGQGIIHGPRGSEAAPHRVVKSDVPKNMCVRCHDPGPVQLTTTFLCWFETRREAVAAGRSTSCRDCHMPTIERPIAVGQPSRKTLRHTFVGPVPKTFAGLATREARGFVPGVVVDVKRDQDTLRIGLINKNAAHNVTTADPERHLLLQLEVTAASGKKTVRTERIGQQWDWGDASSGKVAHRVFDNRLVAGERRDFDVALGGAQKVHIVLTHVRLTSQNRAHMMNAALDAELRALAPHAADDLTHMPERYPGEARMYEATYDIASGKLERTAIEELGRLDAEQEMPKSDDSMR